MHEAGAPAMDDGFFHVRVVTLPLDNTMPKGRQ